jgi:serine/threonine protein kinase
VNFGKGRERSNPTLFDFGNAVERQLLSTTADATSFAFVKLLGLGSFGAVLLARCSLEFHPFPTKLYAVKMMYNFENLITHRRRNLYLREFALLAGLDPHPRIVKIWCRFDSEVPDSVLGMLPADTRDLMTKDEFGQQRLRISTTFAVFEYHPRNVLAWRKTQPPILPFASFYPLAIQLLAGLRYLEASNIQHRDLKMDNLLLKSDDSICICDFSEAVRLVSVWVTVIMMPSFSGMCCGHVTVSLIFCSVLQPSASRLVTFTQSDSGMGNPAHVAPEVANSISLVSESSPVATIDFSGQASFEAGVLLFEIATCQHPLPGYPSGYFTPTGKLKYSDSQIIESEEMVTRLEAAGYPASFTSLVRSMVTCRTSNRLTLTASSQSTVFLCLHSALAS